MSIAGGISDIGGWETIGREGSGSGTETGGALTTEAGDESGDSSTGSAPWLKMDT